MKEKKEYPLIIVFYLDREMMQNAEIMNAFAKSVDTLISVKEFNAMAFFLPTDGEERVECINPIIAPEEQMQQVDKLINDIKVNFDINKK